MKRKGYLITFEGGDGAGKTTLIERVYSYLSSRSSSVIKTRAPGGTAIGQGIRHTLLSTHDTLMSKRCELLLFLADRAQHVDEVILPALKEKKIVLCDRFNDSTLAYQGGARGGKERFVRSLLSFASDALVPDLTLYLDLDPTIAFARVQKAGLKPDRIESERLSFHRKIRKAFHAIHNKEPKRFILIDASRTPDEVFEQAREHIDALLKPHRK